MVLLLRKWPTAITRSLGWPYSHLRQSLFLGEIPVYGWTNKGRANDPEFTELRRVMNIMKEDGSSTAYMNGIGVDFGFKREE